MEIYESSQNLLVYRFYLNVYELYEDLLSTKQASLFEGFQQNNRPSSQQKISNISQDFKWYR